MQLELIGVIHTPFKEAAGTPIQPAMAEGAEGVVEVLPEFEEALADLENFERVWLVYWFDRSTGYQCKVKPFLEECERGLFSTRAPRRPNQIGLSCVRLLSVEGCRLRVADVDMLDGTPLLDIKPYVPRFDAYPDARAGWLDSAERVNHSDVAADERFSKHDD